MRPPTNATTMLLDRMSWFAPALRGTALLAILLLLAGCETESERRPVPKSLVETVKVPGYDLVRFWGDEKTPDFDAAIRRQFESLRNAAKTGALPDADKTANILAISGGGDQGAFAAGFMKGWSEKGTRPKFDTVTGVSTGALAAPFAFLGAAQDHCLEEIYTDNTSSQLYDTRWDLGLVGDALKDTQPLRELIGHYVDDAFLDEIAAQYRLGRRLLVSTTNLDAQRPVIWDLSAIAASGRADRRKLFTDILVATSAIPGIFPPVRIPVVGTDGKTYDELHGDGSIAMEMFFLPPGIRIGEAEAKVFGKARERSLYVLRNGRLFPEYRPMPDKATALVQRGVLTLVKYQVVYNLRLLENAANDSRTKFQFMGIPKTFRGPTKDKFDAVYAKELFARARTSGFNEEWVKKVPESPEQSP